MLPANKNIILNSRVKYISSLETFRKIYYLAVVIPISISNAQIKNSDSLFASKNHLHEISSALQHDDRKESNSVSNNENLFSNLSGSWRGLRTDLSQLGMDFQFVYKGEFLSNVSGGDRKGTTSLDNIDLILNADLEKSFGFVNTNLLVQFLGNSGGVPNDMVGSAQGITNIETVSTWKVYQILLQKKYFGESLSIAIGLYDFNSEFDTRETSSIFINPSHGVGPDLSQSGLNGPSIFPTTSLALRIKYEFENGSYFQTAFLDGVPGDPENPFGTHIIFDKNDGLLIGSEFGIVSKQNDSFQSKVALGVWFYTSDFERNSFTSDNQPIISLEKSYGLYLNAEKMIATNPVNPNQNFSGFIRMGYANQNINPIDFYLGGGIKYSGLFTGKKEDALGLAIAYAHNSPAYIKSAAILNDVTIKSYEINIETTYLLHITQWLIVQPDIQYIINPSYSSQSNNALVMGSRMQIIF